MAEKNVQNDFSKGNIPAVVMRMALPLIAAQLVNVLYNVVDRIYIGHIPNVGSMALTGVGIALPVISILSAFAGLFGQGGAPLCSMARGRGDNGEASRVMGNAFSMLLVSSVALGLLTWAFLDPVITVFAADKEASSYARECYNLSIANAYVQDKIDAVPVFFAKRWLIGLGNSLSSNAWAALSLLFFALTLVGLGAYLLLRRVALQKAGFYGALVSVAAFALAVVYAAVGRSQRIHPAEAIVMSTAAPVKSSPDPQSKDIFVLHEGTKVAVGDSLGDWREIRIADGNKGWVQVSAIEMID